jgi:hypothetical protein
LRITGINADSAEAFAAAAETCFLEVCDCTSLPTIDDVAAPDSGQAPFVGCDNGMCLAIWPLE